jgi:N12 class adenine-specific DNA methylase
VSEARTAALVNDMPDGPLVLALEMSFKPAITAAKAAKSGDPAREARAERAPILSRRVVMPYEPPGQASNATDALQISLSEFGRIDLARVAQLRGISEDAARAELTGGDPPLAYYDPEAQHLVPRDLYLTGEVRRKLRAAEAAGLDANAEALRRVQPEAIGSENVNVILGSAWVPDAVYSDFVTHLTGEPARVRFQAATNTRAVSGAESTKSQEWAAADEGGRVRVGAVQLVSDILNSRATKVYDTDGDGNRVLNKAASELAALKRRDIEREFGDWVFADADRRRSLVETFNDKFNTRVSRQFDGGHLILPGKVPDEVVRLRRHQKNAVWRGISERFMLFDHVVGAGKTFTAIARVMERRRMGLSKKPMIVVPNHMVEQFAADVLRLYPGAKVLAAGAKDFEKRARRRLFGRIATGDWDVVVVPHSSFKFIALSPETEQRFLDEAAEALNPDVEGVMNKGSASDLFALSDAAMAALPLGEGCIRSCWCSDGSPVGTRSDMGTKTISGSRASRRARRRSSSSP